MAELGARVGRSRAGWGPPVFSLLAVPRRLFCLDSLVTLDVARYYLWLFSLYMDVELGKNRC